MMRCYLIFGGFACHANYAHIANVEKRSGYTCPVVTTLAMNVYLGDVVATKNQRTEIMKIVTLIIGMNQLMILGVNIHVANGSLFNKITISSPASGQGELK